MAGLKIVLFLAAGWMVWGALCLGSGAAEYEVIRRDERPPTKVDHALTFLIMCAVVPALVLYILWQEWKRRR